MTALAALERTGSRTVARRAVTGRPGTQDLVDAGFLHEKIFEDFAHLQTDGVAVFDEVRFRRFGQSVGDHVGQFVNFVAAQSQCNSLEIPFTSESQNHREIRIILGSL